jgi:hypothetical protein
MRGLRFPIAVALGLASLLVGLVAVGALAAGTALAGGPPFAGPPWAWSGAHRAGGGPAGLGFAPFDELREGRPFTLEVTPGTVTAASQTGVTLQTRDGATRAFTVDAQTHLRATPAGGEQVVVVTMNGASNALAVLGPRGGYAWWGGAR